MSNLNLSTGGDFTPFIKYNAKAGRWFVRGEHGDIEVQNPRFALDLENIKTGWIYFPQGGAPQFLWDVDGERAARPSQNHKDGFEVMLYGADVVPGLGQPLGWRQWTSNANAAKAAMLKMYGEWEANKQEGKVPVFQCTGVNVVPSDYGDNFEPIMVLEKWIDRANLPSPPEHSESAPAGNGNTTMPPVGSDPALQGPPPGHPANPDEAPF